MKWIKLLLRNSIRMKSMQMWLKKNSPEWNDKLFWLEHGRWKIWIHFLDNSTNESIHPIGPQTPLNIPSGIPKWTRATGPDPSIGSIHRIHPSDPIEISIEIDCDNIRKRGDIGRKYSTVKLRTASPASPASPASRCRLHSASHWSVAWTGTEPTGTDRNRTDRNRSKNKIQI